MQRKRKLDVSNGLPRKKVPSESLTISNETAPSDNTQNASFSNTLDTMIPTQTYSQTNSDVRHPRNVSSNRRSPESPGNPSSNMHSATTVAMTPTGRTRAVIPTKDNPPPEMSHWLIQFSAWSNAERIMALNELITRCEPTQVRHMMQVGNYLVVLCTKYFKANANFFMPK